MLVLSTCQALGKSLTLSVSLHLFNGHNNTCLVGLLREGDEKLWSAWSIENKISLYYCVLGSVLCVRLT